MLRQWKSRLRCSRSSNTHHYYVSIDNELKNIFSKLNELSNETHLLTSQFNQLEERYERWIAGEQNCLHKRIEKLENDNHQINELHQIYHMRNEKSTQTITNLLMKILFTQKEIRKHCVEKSSANTKTKSNAKQPKSKLHTRSESWNSCYTASNKPDESNLVTNEESFQQSPFIDNRDQKTTKQSSELNDHLTMLTNLDSEPERSRTGSTNKLYLIMNDGCKTQKTTQTNRSLTANNTLSADDNHSFSPSQQRSSSVTVVLNKNRSNQHQINTMEHNKEKLSPSYHTPSSSTSPSNVKSKSNNTTTSALRPSRIPIMRNRSPKSNVQQSPSKHKPVVNKKSNVPSQTNSKQSLINFTPFEPLKPLQLPSPITTQKSSSVTVPLALTNHTKKCVPASTRPTADSPALDAFKDEPSNMQKSDTSEKPKATILLRIANHIQPALFSTDNLKRIQPVRSHELKSFSYHLTPDILSNTSSQTNDSLSTLTSSSAESIMHRVSDDNPLIETDENDKSCITTNNSTTTRDFSKDSLNENERASNLIEKDAMLQSAHNDEISCDLLNDATLKSIHLLNENKFVENSTIEQEHKLSTDSRPCSEQEPPSSLTIASTTEASSQKPFVHRLVFPERLGRLIFYRRVLSDSDIHLKNCSKDDEINHNVYHLDTIRDYSMEFYMLTTYASDSQLRAWIDLDDHEFVDGIHDFDESLFQKKDTENDACMNQRQTLKTYHSKDSLNHNEELDWYSELEIVSSSLNSCQGQYDNTSCHSSDVYVEEFFRDEQLALSHATTTASTTSTDSTLPLMNLSSQDSDSFQSTSLQSEISDRPDSPPEGLSHQTHALHQTTSNTGIIQQSSNNEQYDDNSTPLVVTDEFQPDFYYLCPITNTINFSTNDYRPLLHDL